MENSLPSRKQYRHFIISLAEAAAYIQEAFRELSAYRVQTALSARLPFYRLTIDQMMDYNAFPFLNELLMEMHSSTDIDFQRAPSTNVLISDGMDPVNAQFITRNVFDIVLSNISTYVPDMTFKDLELYDFALTDGYDLNIFVNSS